MGKIFLVLLTVVFVDFVYAAELTIVDVKRNIPLSDSDPVYKDFYIQTESARDLKKNSLVVVKRKITIRDGASKTIGDIETVVGVLKIISAEGKVAVGREQKMIPRDNEALLEQPFIMVGDRVDANASAKEFAVLPSLKPRTRLPASTVQPTVVTPAALPGTEPATPLLSTPALKSPEKNSTVEAPTLKTEI